MTALTDVVSAEGAIYNRGESRFADDIANVFEMYGLEAPTKSEVKNLNGRSVIAFDVPNETLEALKKDPALLARVQNGLKTALGGGVCGGICIGLIIACIVMTPFAIAGGVVLGIGNQRLTDNDPSNDNQAREMVTAGTAVLAAGGGLAGLIGVIYAIVTGVGICCSLK